MTGHDDRIEEVRNQVTGAAQEFESPFGPRKVVYADWIASGRAYEPIERYINDSVLPFYANTHTSTSITGLQSTCFRQEARQIIQQAVNANSVKDVVLFTGSGSTAAVNKLVHALGLTDTSMHSNDPQSRPVVFVGPFEHHSNLLPWRESCADVVTVPETPTGDLDIAKLSELLQSELYRSRPLKIGSFSACSNVTGIVTNVDQVTVLLHKNGALACWDYACAGPYIDIDMNPVTSKGFEGDADPDRAFLQKDAIFLSPHKFLGGINTPGVLVAKKTIFANHVPTAPNLGGGSVFYVTEKTQRYLRSRVEREEGGTPDVVGAIRAGLCFQLKESVGSKLISDIENRMWQSAAKQLNEHPKIELLGYSPDVAEEQEHVAIFSFLIRHGKQQFLHYDFVCALLNDLFGIQSRGGCMCAGPYSQRLLGMSTETIEAFEDELVNAAHYCEYLRPGFSRLSFPFFMSKEEQQFVIQAILAIAEHGWRLLPHYRFNSRTGEWKHKSRHTKFLHRMWLSHANMFPNLQETRTVSTTVGAKVSPDRAPSFDKVIEIAVNIMQEGHGSERLGDQKQLLTENAQKLKWFVLPSEALEAMESESNEDDSMKGTTSAPEELDVQPVNPARYFEMIANRVVAEYPKPALFGKETATESPSASSTEVEMKKKQTASVNVDEQTSFPEQSSNTPISSSTTAAKRAPNKCIDGQCTDPNGACFLPRKDIEVGTLVVPSAGVVAATTDAMAKATLFAKPPKKILKSVGMAMHAFNMIQEGDRLLLGLSGGKDSLGLLHILLDIQKRSPVRFELGACTIDPGTVAFDPSPLIPYVKSLGIEYHYVKQNIFEDASSGSLQGASICSFCARMKRGALYTTARENKYNVLVLAQHLDDMVESWLMGALHNGQMRTMKANYTEKKGDVRIIRPLAYTREEELKQFSYKAKLPVINENCPACFEAPQERKRVKKLLAKEEAVKPTIFNNLRRAIVPLMDDEALTYLKDKTAELEKAKQRNNSIKRKTRTPEPEKTANKKQKVEQS